MIDVNPTTSPKSTAPTVPTSTCPKQPPRTRYREVTATKLYHGTTLERAESILKNGPQGKALYVTPSPRVAENFACMKRPCFGSQRQRTIAILSLTPRTDTLSLAEPIVTLTPFGGRLVAQYQDNSHYDQADLAWNPQYQYQFLTQKGAAKYTMTLPEAQIKAPNCLQMNLFQSCLTG